MPDGLNDTMQDKLKKEIARSERAEKINHVLFQISNSLNTSENLDDLYRMIHKSLGMIIDSSNFFIALYHEKNDSITFPYCIDVTDGSYDDVMGITKTASLTAEVIRSGKPLLVDKDEIIAGRLNNCKKIPNCTPSEIWLGVPLINQNKVMGVMAVQSYVNKNLYDKTDMDVMLSVADQVAVAIEFKRSENALQESHERYQALSDATFEAVFISEDGMCLDANKTAYSMFGYSGKELTGIFGTDVIAAESKTLVRENMLSGYEKPYEAIARKKDGTRFCSEIRGCKMNYKGKNVRVTVVRDISEQKKAEKEKLDLEKKLRQSHKMEAIGTLAGGIAHNFNNILGIVLGNAELALDDIPKWNSARGHLEEIRIATLRAKDVVRQLLGFSQTPELQKKPIKLQNVLEDTVGLLKASIPVSIELKLSVPVPSCIINANHTDISQLIINLCTNSVHAIVDELGTIDISLNMIYYDGFESSGSSDLRPGEYAKITIADTGSGIDPEIKERIFDPYFTTREFGKGVGMGLAVVHGIVRSHNGHISIKSKEQQGTTVTIYFPIIADAYTSHRGHADEQFGGNERVLIVDDEEPIVRMCKKLLEKYGYQVDVMTDPVKALDIFSKKPDRYDLVLTDMSMPKLSGDQLVSQMLAIKPDLPVIFSSGYSQDFKKEMALKSGAIKYIEKPLDTQTLIKTIRSVLDSEDSDSKNV